SHTSPYTEAVAHEVRPEMAAPSCPIGNAAYRSGCGRRNVAAQAATASAAATT
ncbi:MAG: hypothetical protein RIQ79_795, partial [Verrucomicrobiota bacterium]